MTDFKQKNSLKKFLNAAMTYTLPPVTITRYLKLLVNADSTPKDLGFHPENRDPEFIKAAMKIMRPFFESYFRLEISGLENLPATGSGLVVGNHNGGLEPVDTFIAAMEIMKHFGVERRVYGLGHDFIFRESSLGEFVELLGGLRANNYAAHMAFALDSLVIVYPGGDLDTFRSFKNRDKIDFGGRKGFIKLALKEKVPVYPMVSAGAHETFFVLSRGEKIAEKLNFHKKLRTSVFPLVFSIPWGITSGFMPYIPLPSKISIRFLEPIIWDDLSEKDAENSEVLEKCYSEVTEKMQKALTEMYKQRKYPILG